jgi:hypothetical protein
MIAHGIGLDNTKVRTDRYTRRHIENQLHVWEHRLELVTRYMPAKGFTTEQVDAAVAECEKMLDWYDRLLEQYE